MVLIQTFGFGLLVREVLRRAAGNQAEQIGKHVARTTRGVATVSKNTRRKLNHFEKVNPFSADEIRARLGGSSTRHSSRLLSTKTSEIDLKELLKDEKWFPVYRFHGIGFCLFLARLKLVQTIISTCLLPYSVYLLQNNLINPEIFAGIVSGAILAPIALILFTRYYNRIIGVISMDSSNNFIRIGYLSFWGNRRNKYMEVSEVFPLTELQPKDIWSPIITMRFYSSNEVLYLSKNKFEIVDPERAELLFGDLSKLSEEKPKIE
uniref:Transmembrane protein 186 n=1 Tax=Acrobeloides nanus TaxID=290746 RepID=A0A914CB88_9BILA